jgi:nucleoside-diphosphate-sugar epimerase
MRFLVTGASGFLGQRIVSRLLRRGHFVRCPIRQQPNQSLLTAIDGFRDSVEFVEGALHSLPKGLANGCEIVIHCASQLSGSCAVLFANNVVGTRKLLAIIRNSDVKRFIHISSLAVYQTSNLSKGDVLDENTPLETEPHLRDYYTFSKVVQEHIIAEEAKHTGLCHVTIRPGVIYGPTRSPINTRVGLRFGRVLIRMGGRQRLPFTYVDNCADAVVLASTVDGVAGRAYNIVDDELPTGLKVIRQYRELVGPLKVLAVPAFAIPYFASTVDWYSRRSKGQVPVVLTRYRANAQWRSLNYSNARARTDLNWHPQVSLNDGLRKSCLSLNERLNNQRRP